MERADRMRVQKLNCSRDSLGMKRLRGEWLSTSLFTSLWWMSNGSNPFIVSDWYYTCDTSLYAAYMHAIHLVISHYGCVQCLVCTYEQVRSLLNSRLCTMASTIQQYHRCSMFLWLSQSVSLMNVCCRNDQNDVMKIDAPRFLCYLVFPYTESSYVSPPGLDMRILWGTRTP